ncbi:ABC transporter substrate-binding protein [Elioraea sp. Yellowstone]|jgi:peptide/nickel transport system substrate-binding protein|nr:ABC transporter substrate-binding protein [Elioraea sp. Yellowstone]
MRFPMAVLAATLAFASVAADTDAKAFRFATTSDAATLDPHANNAFFTYLITGQIYEPLVDRGDDLKVMPGLALRWERVEPTRWRFWLREGVRFHNGNAFDADDVVFSIARATSPTSNFTIYVDTVERAEKVSPYVVDLVTRVPDAVIPDKLTRVLMMDKEWSEANGAARPQNLRDREETFAARNANGTGPFMLRSREPDVRTVLARNPDWWGGPAGPTDVTEWQHVVIASDATRIAALLSGEVDFVHTVPHQDVARLQRDQRLKVLVGQENRTMWLAMDQERDELGSSNIRGRNPFKDARVREAVAISIDMEAIRTRVLRGLAVPTASMWTQFVTGYDPAYATRPAVDRERAKRLLAEAGYPDGFEVALDCPAGAYDGVCQAAAAMLAQIGIRVRLEVMPNSVFIQKIREGRSSFYGLTWGVPTFDALYTLRGIMMTRGQAGGGSWNWGGYSNPRVDALIREIEAATDPEKRTALIHEAQRVHNGEFGHIPLYHLMIPFAMKANIVVTHRADNLVFGRSVRVE